MLVGGITKFHHPFIGGITKFQVSKMGGITKFTFNEVDYTLIFTKPGKKKSRLRRLSWYATRIFKIQ